MPFDGFAAGSSLSPVDNFLCWLKTRVSGGDSLKDTRELRLFGLSGDSAGDGRAGFRPFFRFGVASAAAFFSAASSAACALANAASMSALPLRFFVGDGASGVVSALRFFFFGPSDCAVGAGSVALASFLAAFSAALAAFSAAFLAAFWGGAAA
jgi:hypothetical protein